MCKHSSIQRLDSSNWLLQLDSQTRHTSLQAASYEQNQRHHQQTDRLATIVQSKRPCLLTWVCGWLVRNCSENRNNRDLHCLGRNFTGASGVTNLVFSSCFSRMSSLLTSKHIAFKRSAMIGPKCQLVPRIRVYSSVGQSKVSASRKDKEIIDRLEKLGADVQDIKKDIKWYTTVVGPTVSAVISTVLMITVTKMLGWVKSTRDGTDGSVHGWSVFHPTLYLAGSVCTHRWDLVSHHTVLHSQFWRILEQQYVLHCLMTCSLCAW